MNRSRFFLSLLFFSLYLMPTQEFDWYSIISQFPSLTTLEGPLLLIDSESSEANSETIRTLLQLCPKMRRLLWFQSDLYPRVVGPDHELPALVAIIEREGRLVKWNVRSRFPDTEGAVHNSQG